MGQVFKYMVVLIPHNSIVKYECQYSLPFTGKLKIGKTDGLP